NDAIRLIMSKDDTCFHIEWISLVSSLDYFYLDLHYPRSSMIELLDSSPIDAKGASEQRQALVIFSYNTLQDSDDGSSLTLQFSMSAGFLIGIVNIGVLMLTKYQITTFDIHCRRFQ